MRIFYFTTNWRYKYPIRHITGYVELSPLYHKRVGLSKLYAGTRTLFGYKDVQTIYSADAAAMHDIVLADSEIVGSCLAESTTTKIAKKKCGGPLQLARGRVCARPYFCSKRFTTETR
jgi:hypothetical protein